MKIKAPKYKYKNALLLDDDELDNFINQKTIEATNLAKNIYMNTSGKKALELINQMLASAANDTIFPDIMFVDLNMPIMNGFEFIEEFKKLTAGKIKKCEIVILTSSVDTRDRIKAAEMDDRIVFLNKPLTVEVLNKLVFEKPIASSK